MRGARVWPGSGGWLNRALVDNWTTTTHLIRQATSFRPRSRRRGPSLCSERIRVLHDSRGRALVDFDCPHAAIDRRVPVASTYMTREGVRPDAKSRQPRQLIDCMGVVRQSGVGNGELRMMLIDMNESEGRGADAGRACSGTGRRVHCMNSRLIHIQTELVFKKRKDSHRQRQASIKFPFSDRSIDPCRSPLR